jgi:hypothetical protein
VFDAIEIEKRGIPTVTIAHDTFATVAAMHARILGLEEIPIIVEPAPESGVVGDDVERFADETFDQLLDGLLAPGRRGDNQ